MVSAQYTTGMQIPVHFFKIKSKTLTDTRASLNNSTKMKLIMNNLRVLVHTLPVLCNPSSHSTNFPQLQKNPSQCRLQLPNFKFI